jgi:hypothetical protein
MHGSGFKKQIFIEVVKANKAIMMKTCFFYIKNPNNLKFENYQVN